MKYDEKKFNGQHWLNCQYLKLSQRLQLEFYLVNLVFIAKMSMFYSRKSHLDPVLLEIGNC